MSEHALASAALGERRPVWLYEAPGRASGAPLLVLLDGDRWSGPLPIWDTLDNLVADGRLPPLVAVLPSAMSMERRWTELACHPPFLAFVLDELLPWVAHRRPVTADPARTIIAGQSLGGVTALHAGLVAPWRFGNVLAQSASLWWPTGAPGEMTRRYARAPRVPVRVRFEVGLQEWVLLGPHRELRDVLAARGYDVAYTEYNGGHDELCWRGGLAEGLVALAAGWSSP